MTYHELLDFANAISPGDKSAAETMLNEITGLLDRGSVDLTEDGRRYLYKIRKKWEARANGQDTRWNSHGSKPGRRKSSGRASATLRNEEETDPLLASIMKKFGKPLAPEDI